MQKMSAPATEKLTEKEIVVNGTSEVDGEVAAVEPKPQLQCENAVQSESLADWFVMACVILCNAMNGINYAAYGVLYLPIADMFQASRAAVGWIQSFDFALGTFLGKLYESLTELYFLSFDVVLGCI